MKDQSEKAPIIIKKGSKAAESPVEEVKLGDVEELTLPESTLGQSVALAGPSGDDLVLVTMHVDIEPPPVIGSYNIAREKKLRKLSA